MLCLSAVYVFAADFHLYRWYRYTGDFQLMGARGAFILFYRTVSAEVDVYGIHELLKMFENI